MPGEKTRKAIAAQPAWLRQVPTDRRLPEGATVVFTGCGTSFHAAVAGGGAAVQALDLVDEPPEADVLVLVSHEGATPVTLEAARAFGGPKWLVTGKPDGPIADLCEHVVVATPELEESYCHTASYTCAVVALRALRGEDVSALPAAVEAALAREPWPVSAHERYAVVGPAAARGTVEEAALKLREAAHVAAEAHHTEQLLHGHLAALDEGVRCFVLAPEGRAGERARDVGRALDAIGAEHALLESVHPVVDIVPFQRLAVDLADARGVDADVIRWDDPRWKAARDAYD